MSKLFLICSTWRQLNCAWKIRASATRTRWRWWRLAMSRSPAVAVGVDRQAKGVVALVDCATDMVVDPLRGAAHINLKDREAVARCLGSLVEPRFGDRRKDDAMAEGARRRATVAPPPGSKTCSEPTGAHSTGMRSFLPNSELLQSTFETSRNTRGRNPIASSARRSRARVVSVSEPPLK